MKKLYMILVSLILIFLSGCSYKNSTISIESYQTNFLSFKKYHKKVYLNSFEDKRANKQIIAIVTDNDGNNLGYTTTDTDFATWYKNALKKALIANGFDIAQKSSDASFTIDLKLKNLLVTFNKSILTKENLTGNISLTLTIKKSNETITKNISENLSKYNGLSVSKESFKKEIKTLLDDSIKLIVKNLSNL